MDWRAIASRRHHDLLVDLMTGRIIDFSCSEIERLQARLVRRFGYRIVDHRLDIYVKPIQSTKASRLHRRSRD
jgi:Fur family transcriptional regulator, ferric uptake regulator